MASSPRAGLRKPVRGVGLTPRIFKSLVQNSDRHFEALPATYVATINNHVLGNHMAENWCPVIVESETGNRWVLHVDPLQVRQCRMKLRQELFDVQEKRARMLRRIKALRAELPKADPKELAACWAQELQEAQDRKGEKLLRAFPPSRHITVFLEISANMVQLELVCRHLREELPKQIEAAGAGLLTLVALDGGRTREEAISEPLSAKGREALGVWLDSLSRPDSARKGDRCELRMAKRLRKAIAADALVEGPGAALFILCSVPADAQDCEALLRRAEFTLQVVGVLGACPEDPEICFERLVKAAAPGSALHLWFGEDYWSAFAEARQRQLESWQSEPGADETLSDGEVVSSNVLEIRLLERIMRECYVEEQRCEEELGILGQLLAKELAEPQELKSALKNEAPEEVPEVDSIAAPSMGLEDLARIALSSTRRA